MAGSALRSSNCEALLAKYYSILKWKDNARVGKGERIIRKHYLQWPTACGAESVNDGSTLRIWQMASDNM